jgi:hypothetical protein
MSSTPFSAAPELDEPRIPADDRRDVATLVECGSCGREHDSARSALNCTHE